MGEAAVRAHDGFAPLGRCPGERTIGENRQAPVGKESRDNDSDIVASSARVQANGRLLDQLVGDVVMPEPFFAEQRVGGDENHFA